MIGLYIYFLYQGRSPLSPMSSLIPVITTDDYLEVAHKCTITGVEL